MVCPKCGAENTDGAVECVTCGAELLPASRPPAAEPTVSANAVVALGWAVVGATCLGMIISNPEILPRLFYKPGRLGALGFGLLVWVPAIIIGRIAKRQIRLSGGRLRGCGLAQTAIVLNVCTVLAAIAVMSVPFLYEVQYPCLRGRVSRARTDMRSLSVAIEQYYVDHNIYPAWGMAKLGPGGTQTYNYWIGTQSPGPTQMPRVVRRDPAHSIDVPTSLPSFLSGPLPKQNLAALTTPNAYITAFPPDPFCRVRGATFVYWSIFPGQPDPSGKIVGKDSAVKGGVGWILISAGPDLDYDIAGDWEVYDPSIAQPTERLLAGSNKRGSAFTYDPTNGAMSHGDIWRVKQ